MTVRCWVCQRKIVVADDRRMRNPKRDGYNTVDENIRVCHHCWGKIKRADVSRIPAFRDY